MIRPTRNDYAFFIPLVPRWGDMDALGHVNNAKFFTYDESARLAYFAALMKDDPRFWKDYGMILAHIEADFLVQLVPPVELAIGFRVTKFGVTSLRTESTMFRGEDAIAVVRGVSVWFDYRTNTALPVPTVVRDKIRALERVAPEIG